MLIVATCWIGFHPTLLGACRSDGKPGRSPQLRDVCLGESVSEETISAPDSRKQLIISAIGRIRLQVDGQFVALPSGMDPLDPPTEVSWSPDSQHLFVNNGHGSGTDGWTIDVFELQDNTIRRLADVNAALAKAFRNAIRCSPQSVDPNVWGMGWDSASSKLFVLIQSTVHQSCGNQGTFRSAVIDVESGAIDRLYSAADTRRVFQSLLPSNLK